jgi:predicted ATP-binding protein involved in virulence
MPFQIRSTTFHNIKNFATLNIRFGSKITCLIGENGIGKTTILQALSWGLVGNIEDLNIDNSFVRLKNDAINKEETASIELDYNGLNGQATNKLVIETKPPLYKTIPKFYTDNEQPFAQENGLLNQLFIAFSQQTQKKDKRRDNRSKIRQANIDDVSSFLMGEPDTRFDDVLDWLAAAMDTNTPLDERDATLPIIQKVLDVIGDITNTPMRLVVETNARSEVKIEFTETGQRMPLRFLSQGFNNVIGWVGFFMKRLWESWESCKTAKSKHFFEHPALCLIDEIDTYLHPKWQRTILNVLIKHFPNTQWVVTTHSPLVIGNLDYPSTEDVIIYNINLDGTAIMLSNAFGKDNNHLNYAYFGVPFRNEKMQKNLDDLFEMIENEEKEAAELLLAQLETQLGSDDVDIVRAQILLDF